VTDFIPCVLEIRIGKLDSIECAQPIDGESHIPPYVTVQIVGKLLIVFAPIATIGKPMLQIVVAKYHLLQRFIATLALYREAYIFSVAVKLLIFNRSKLICNHGSK